MPIGFKFKIINPHKNKTGAQNDFKCWQKVINGKNEVLSNEDW